MADNDNKELRFNSGNAFCIMEDDGITPYYFGKLLGGKLSVTEGETPVTFSDGSTFEGPGATACKFSVTISQITNENISKINAFKGELRKAFYQNGKNLNGDDQDIYIPELKIKSSIELDMKGQTLQTIIIEGSCAPQSTDIQITPSDTMPEGFPSKVITEPVTSNSPYYCIAENPAGA